MTNDHISWEDFEKIELRAGTICEVAVFPEARKPAYKIWVDFGVDIGIRKSSAQVTANYSPEELLGKQVLCVLNFPEKQIGPFTSQILITGFPDENNNIVLATTQSTVPDGAKLF